jgi:hypothetical protein
MLKAICPFEKCKVFIFSKGNFSTADDSVLKHFFHFPRGLLSLMLD